MFFFNGFELIPLAVLGLIVLAIVALSGNRAVPDPLGRRPLALYLTIISFVALFVVLFAGFTTVNELVRLGFQDDQPTMGMPESCIVDPDSIECSGQMTFTQIGPGDPFAGPDRFGDAHISGALRAAIFAAIAGAVLWFHLREISRLRDEDSFVGSAAERVYVAYLYAVCFVAMLTTLGAAAAAGYAIFRIAAPGVSGFGDTGLERDQGFVQLISSAVLAASAGLIFAVHWRRAGGPGRAAPPPPPPA